ncbi:hypothetical protein [Streptomyces sp. NPDC057418]|uniref:hypothetical protein n=1 Tax=Streptomyces sp. NPDC057418 TaxID=3346126 RepID=UPI0036CFBCD3
MLRTMFKEQISTRVKLRPELEKALALVHQFKEAAPETPVEGQVTAASKDNHGGRPKVIDDDMLTFAVALKGKDVPVPEIVKKLTITRLPPRRSTSASGSSPSPIRTPRSAADSRDQALSANGCTAGPHGRSHSAPPTPTDYLLEPPADR